MAGYALLVLCEDCWSLRIRYQLKAITKAVSQSKHVKSVQGSRTTGTWLFGSTRAGLGKPLETVTVTTSARKLVSNDMIEPDEYGKRASHLAQHQHAHLSSGAIV